MFRASSSAPMVRVVGRSGSGGSGAPCSGLFFIKACWSTVAIVMVLLHRQYLNSTLQSSTNAAASASTAVASSSDTGFGNNKSLRNSAAAVAVSSDASSAADSWCDTVRKARSDLDKELHINVPCDTMKAAKSAIVCYLTAGVPDGQGNHKVFSGTDYINGALALGASLQDHVSRDDVHRLLLIRDGFTIPDDKIQMLEAVGWTLGKAPKVEVDEKYIPRYERYKTLYTKISVIGLAEYDCVLLLDADALTVGNIDDLMSCQVLEPNYRVAGTLDYYHGQWYHFNTGSALWRPSSQEMNRVYGMTKDNGWMRRFESDQIFTNTVYPDRTNRTLNAMILSREVGTEAWGQVADLGWQYNAQTHVENQLSDYWEEHLKEVKIIHFTHAKGWQCPERHGGPPEPKQTFPRHPEPCKKTPGCACNEGYRWYDYLDTARERAKKQ